MKTEDPAHENTKTIDVSLLPDGCSLWIEGRYVMKSMKKHKKYVAIAFLILLISMVVFYKSHPTYYKYNDIWIIGNTISDIENRYGEFELFNSAYAAYYIYTDNKGFLPDHLKHYYYMYYDENNVVYKVEDSCQPGG